jgi:hypothetical protein
VHLVTRNKGTYFQLLVLFILVKYYNQGREMHTGFCWGSLTGSDHLKDLGVGGRILKIDFKEMT